MDSHGHSRHTRRQILQIGFALPVTFVMASSVDRLLGLRRSNGMVRGATYPPTPACSDGDDATPVQTEGPYYKRRSPERASLLEPSITGTKLILTGYVLSRRCEPIAHALLDFWQADHRGTYDNRGYRLRGHQFTDDAGRYRLETVVPGLYPGRTRHLHVKVQAPHQRILTTQLYFPGEPYNTRDRIFNSALLMQVEETAEGKTAVFDFALDLA